MKKVYVNPAIIERDVRLPHYLNKVSAARTIGGYNREQLGDDFNFIDVENDKPNDDIWKNL